MRAVLHFPESTEVDRPKKRGVMNTIKTRGKIPGRPCVVLIFGLVVALGFGGCRGKDPIRPGAGAAGSGRRKSGMASGNSGGRSQGRPGARPEKPKAAVAVDKVSRGNIATYYSATASLDPNKQADVLARVNGILKAPLVEEGDVVREGQLLIEIEDAEYRHRVTQAEVEFNLQRSTLARTDKMLETGLVSDEDADAVKSQMKAAEAALELAKLELSYTKVRAPFAGSVIARHVDEGRTVSNGTQLFTLADLSRLLARVQIPAREFRNIQIDQPVRLLVDSSGDRLQGQILLVSPIVDPTTGTIKVTVAIDHFVSTTRPGDFATISIVTDRHDQVLLVPRIAVLTEHEEHLVYVIEDGLARRRTVKIGFEDDARAEIVSGVEEGENVVVQGQRSLSDGQAVSVLGKIDFTAGAEPKVIPEG